jgi:hypothetical protein
MKVIIAGSRSATDYQDLLNAIDIVSMINGWDISEVVSGTARGADRLGERWAKENNILLKRFPADWDRWGKMAGMLRNADMAKYGNALLALWDGVSRGTFNMIDLAKENDLKIYIHRIMPEGR